MGRPPRAESASAEDAVRLAVRLRSAREAQGWSREELAHRARLSAATLAKIELHATVDPGFFTIARLAEQLALRLDELARHGRGGTST